MPPKSSKRNSPGKSKQDMAVYKCTACSKVIKSNLDAKLHPLIGALVCRKCYSTYGNGDFKELFEDGVDELGDDNYCRWCCDGGDLFGCMNEEDGKERCHYSFCKDCIKKNIPDDEILSIDDLDEEGKQKLKWLCYACDTNKIAKLRKEAEEALKDLIKRGEKKTGPSEASSKTVPSQTLKRPPLADVEIFPIKRRETITNVVSKLKSGLLTPQPKKQQTKIIPTPQKLSDKSEVCPKTKEIGVEENDTKFENIVEIKSGLPSPQPKKQQTKIIPAPQKLSDRLEVYRKTKDICVEEIGIKFNNIFEMSAKGLPKKIIDIEIDSLIKPIQEFQTMLNDIRSHL